MEEDDFANTILPLVDEVYNISRQILYRIINKRGNVEQFDVMYLYTNYSSSISVYSGYSAYSEDDYDDDDNVYVINGDVILVHQKGGNDLERLIDIEILFFEPFSIDEATNEREAKNVVNNIITIVNYDIPRFIRRIDEKISKEVRLGPYLIFFDKKKTNGNFKMNPAQNEYNIQESSPYYWNLDSSDTTFTVTLPFRIINEEAFAPGGKEYERVRKETMVGK